MVVCCSQKAVLRVVDFNVIIKETFSSIVILDILWKNSKLGNVCDGCKEGAQSGDSQAEAVHAASAVQIRLCRAVSACAARASLRSVHTF